MSCGDDAHNDSALFLTSVFATLVKPVYSRDRKHPIHERVEQNWEYIGSRYTNDAELKKVGLGIYLHREPHASEPSLVIVLRGAIPKYEFRSDLYADARIAVEGLQRSKRFERTQALVVPNVILSYYLGHPDWRRQSSEDNICFARSRSGLRLRFWL